MRTVRTKVYKFNELNNDAKENARDWFKNGMEFNYSSEWLDSLKKALNHFDIKLNDYSIDWDNINGCYTKIEFKQDDNYSDGIENLQGVRLWKYLQNNYSKIWNNYTKKYINAFEMECVFTRYCGDNYFLSPIIDFIKKPTNATFKGLIEDCIYELLKGGCNDWDYQQSDEAINETIEVNEYEFTKEGNRF